MALRLARRVLPLLFAALALSACGDRAKAPPAQPTRAVPEVWTTFYPTTWMTRRIAGDLVKVVCPLPADEDPIFWQPPQEALQGYQAADLVVVNGAEFEKWVLTASLPSARLVDTAKAFEQELVRFETGQTHAHGGGAAHTHEGIDGHTWLDPVLAAQQARAIHAGLARILPAQRAALDAGLARLEKDLDALDKELAALGALPEGTWLYASHPAYNYPAKRYGWRVVNLDLDPEAMPDAAALADLAGRLKAKPGRHLLWESTPLPAIAERLTKEAGLTSLTVEPCETESDPKDADGYLTRWKRNLEQLRLAFPAR
jgi:zinc transport system substrate-binding protein